jgi:hypothetical protein
VFWSLVWSGFFAFFGQTGTGTGSWCWTSYMSWTHNDLVAQWLEHTVQFQVVWGSIPCEAFSLVIGVPWVCCPGTTCILSHVLCYEQYISSFLLFFFDMRLPYAFHLTYLNMSLLAGIHKSSNTCLTCVCFMVNTPLPHISHMFNMLFTHVCSTFHYYLNQ